MSIVFDVAADRFVESRQQVKTMMGKFGQITVAMLCDQVRDDLMEESAPGLLADVGITQAPVQPVHQFVGVQGFFAEGQRQGELNGRTRQCKRWPQ